MRHQDRARHAQPYSVDRRGFVRSALTGAAGLWVLSDPLLGRALAAIPGASDVAFAQGVASGQVDTAAATLWTAVDGLTAPSRLKVEVATDAGFANLVARTEALADPAAAGTARVRITSGLQPGQRYWYRFETATGESSPVGTLKTPPPPGSSEPVKIAFFACQDFLVGNYAAHRDLAQQDVDLVVCLGDYIYEQAYFDGAVRAVPETPDGATRTLAEYRTQYATYHSDPHLQAVRAAAPLMAIWDDHEVEDNYAATLPGGASKKGRAIPFLERRANGYNAWWEAMPFVRDPADPNRTYGARRIGQVDLISLDTRQFRTNQPCNPSDAFVSLCVDPTATLSKKATLMGTAQRDFVIDRLQSSTANWKLIANQVMAMSLDIAPGITINTDAWDGYAYERALLCDAIAATGVKDVAFFTGDIHTFFAGSVTRTGRHKSVPVLGLKNGAPVASELVVGSITSQGIADRLGKDERSRNAAAKVLDPILRGANPHLRFSNSAYKGYGIAVASSDALRVEFRAVREPREEQSAVFTLAKFEVPRGVPIPNQVASGPVAPAARTGAPSKTQAVEALKDFVASH
ncbi:MAG: alkaline phosphatase D family protein [Solirubrobacteraceae bacterium]|nr:alkaline phosphatase D family protein [Solirubrobacteraceae bacterium]